MDLEMDGLTDKQTIIKFCRTNESIQGLEKKQKTVLVILTFLKCLTRRSVLKTGLRTALS